MLTMIGHRIVNLDHVREIIPVPKRADRVHSVVILFKDGDQQTYPATIEDMERLTGWVVPAPNGYTLVTASLPEKGDDDRTIVLFRIPVIAFRITGGIHPAVPITAEGEPFESTPYAVIRPDGKVSSEIGDTLGSVEEWARGLEGRQA